jgi:hypothetical protein
VWSECAREERRSGGGGVTGSTRQGGAGELVEVIECAGTVLVIDDQAARERAARRLSVDKGKRRKEGQGEQK